MALTWPTILSARHRVGSMRVPTPAAHTHTRTHTHTHTHTHAHTHTHRHESAVIVSLGGEAI